MGENVGNGGERMAQLFGNSKKNADISGYNDIHYYNSVYRYMCVIYVFAPTIEILPLGKNYRIIVKRK